MFWNAVSCPTRYSVRLYPTKSWFDNDYSVFEMVTGISQRRTASPDDSHRQERANSARVTAKGAKPQESDLSQTVCWVVVVGWNSQLGYIFCSKFCQVVWTVHEKQLLGCCVVSREQRKHLLAKQGCHIFISFIFRWHQMQRGTKGVWTASQDIGEENR